ncbi:hypothetical protein HYV79_05150 [Candidatus Woesearchaeota archaeon]|nr:hypothetical protein [Candidatus Woesearchaeota archaeon]
MHWREIIGDPKEDIKRVTINLFGTSNQYRSLKGNEKISRYLIDVSGIITGAYSFILGNQIQNLNTLAQGAAITLYFILDSAMAINGSPSFIGQIQDQFRWRRISAKQEKEHLLKEAEKEKRKMMVRREVSKELMCFYKDFFGNLGDLEFIYFKKGLCEEEKKDLSDLLKQVDIESQNLPTVGVELEYSSKLAENTIKKLVDGSYVYPNKVPESYSKEYKSEIRILPAKPYVFRWLIEEVGKYLPSEIAPSVQISVGNVNGKRMPYILLALYFMSPDCIFPTVVSENNDKIGYPGVYVGETVDVEGNKIARGQTNYHFMHNSDPNEIADAALFAAKLHSLNDTTFRDFEDDLRELLGFPTRQISVNGKEYIKENDALNELLKKNWPNKERSNLCAYQPPPEFFEYSINKAKAHLGLINLEERLGIELKQKLEVLSEEKIELSEDEIELVQEINNSVKKLLINYAITTSEDIQYCCSFEKALKH